jgi:hypothetical protein
MKLGRQDGDRRVIPDPNCHRRPSRRTAGAAREATHHQHDHDQRRDADQDAGTDPLERGSASFHAC